MADALVSIVKEKVGSALQQEFQLLVGVDDELERISITLTSIQGVLRDAEKRQMKEGKVKVWLEELKDISYNIDDVLDEWNTRSLGLHIEVADTTALVRKVCTSFRCFCLDEDVLHQVFFFLSRFGFNQLIFCQNIAHKIKAIRNRLDWIAEEKKKYHFDIGESSGAEPERIVTSSVVNISKVIGRALDKEVIISKLLSECSHQKEGLPVISIVGMGGLGKTTLAQLVFNDEKVRTLFDKMIWVCVSEPFDKIRVAKAIIEGSGESVPNVHSWQALHQHLSRSVEGKLLLLVFDDVWTEDYQDWEPFKDSLNSSALGSRIIVTTRSVHVAIMMASTYTHNLEILSEDDLWALLSGMALYGRGEEEHKELEEVGRKIALKCKGLPLAAKTLGGLLRFKRTKREWMNILESETWKLEGVEKGIFPALLLSYYDLPSRLKCCFVYCAIFPKDEKIEKGQLMLLWMAQGFLGSEREEEMERVGEECFDNLVMRSLIHVENTNFNGIPKECNMHDLVHDFLQFLANKECVIIDKDAESRVVELGCSTKTRHLTLLCDNTKDIILSICKAVNLRTLRILDGPRFCLGGLFPVSFCNLTCLRSLDLSKSKIEKMPSEIEKLIHLRHLNLSSTKIRELPETVSKLHNLQILKLSYCSELVKLPQGIVNMRKLRYLYICDTSSLTYLPEGIGRLSSLRRLTRFIVSGNGNGCKIGELKNLNHLRGRLQISGLENVRSRNVARELELWNKRQLQWLQLEFDGNNALAGDEGNENMWESVLEGLQPPPNLESLTVEGYLSTKFPKDWMTGDDGLTLSSNLRVLCISNCKNCVRLFLPKLPSLFALYLSGLERVRYMGPKFFGVRDDDDGDDDKDNEDDVKIMPNVASLVLQCCSQLMVLPRHLFCRLRKLWLAHCPALNWTSSCILLPLLEDLSLVGDVGVLSESLAPTHISLPALKSLGIIQSLHSSLPEGLCHLTALEVLVVRYCDNINNLSEELRYLNTIQELRVDCELEREWELAENLSNVLHIPRVYFQDKRMR